MSSNSFDLQQFKSEWLNVFSFIKQFFKNPLQSMGQLPNCHWQTLLVLHASMAGISGFLNGIVTGRISNIVLGGLFIPFTSTMISLIIAGFIYYYLMLILKKQIDFLKLCTLVSVASLPCHITYIISPIASPFLLIGMAGSSILLIVGLVDYFGLPKKSIVKFVGAVFAVYFLMWTSSTINNVTKSSTKKVKATKESLDILEKELSNEK